MLKEKVLDYFFQMMNLMLYFTEKYLHLDSLRFLISGLGMLFPQVLRGFVSIFRSNNLLI